MVGGRRCVVSKGALSPSDRFWSRVDKQGPLPDQNNPHYCGLSPCWMWLGFCNSDGYGHASLNGGLILAHRASWLFSNGEPLPKFVCHKCDNPGCVNPEHLFAGDPLSNMRDCIRKGRQPFTGRKRLLAPEQVANILNLRKAGHNAVGIAVLLGVKYSVILAALRRHPPPDRG